MNKTSEINEKLKKDLDVKNTFALPKITKVILNVGLNKAKSDQKYTEAIQKGLAMITGQKPAFRSARKAISGFKIRQGDKVGLVITLRGKKMTDFIVKLANIVLPRVRDFRGLKPEVFDKQGNYTLGLPEQIVFPEISTEAAENIFGLSITIVVKAKSPEEARKLLEDWGFPFSARGGSALGGKKEQNG